MFEDEEAARPKETTMPRKLDPMSIDALEHYIGELESEIARVRDEIAKKLRFQADAAKIFKS